MQIFSRRLLLPCFLVLLVGGCKPVQDFFKTDRHRLFGPDKVIVAPEDTTINPILPSVGMGDEAQELVPNATFPTEGDWSYDPKDYVIGPTDVLDISILDLFQQGLETVLRRQVSDSGYVDLPLLPQRIRAEGLNQEQYKEAVRDAYREANILQDATVSVTIAARRQNTYSILGAVARPGTYNVLKRDMRLLEALATAGGVTQSNIRHIYVIRPAPATRQGAEEPAPAVMAPESLPPLPEIPPAALPEAEPETRPTATQPAEEADLDNELRALEEALPGAGEPVAPPPDETPKQSVLPMLAETADAGAAADTGQFRRVKWIYSGGRWIRVEEDAPPATRPSGEGATPVRPSGKTPTTLESGAPRGGAPADPYGWRQMERADMARIIAVNLKKLRAGDPRMNIVVRDNDIIEVPTLEIGEFYVGGEVLRPGVYSLTGRRVTVKQAVTAAGNVGPLGWPENSILIRRIGDNQEQIIALNIEAIFKGQDPDVFLKPNDIIAVGTDVRSAFWAVMRNAFRMTYGFGFIYDRNFADPLTVAPTSKRFTRW